MIRTLFLPVFLLAFLAVNPARASITEPEAISCSTTVSNSSATILAADKKRRLLLIQNVDPDEDLGVNPQGGTAAIGTAGTVTLVPNASITFNGKDVPQNAMTGICESGTCQITCIEIR